MVQVITNHVGYDADYTKNAVFCGEAGMKPVSFDVINHADGAVVFSGKPLEHGLLLDDAL